MEMSSLIVMNPSQELVLLDNEHLLPGGNGTPAEVAEKWLKRKFDDSEFRHIIEYHPNDEIVVNIYLLLTNNVAPAISEGFHFYMVNDLNRLLTNQPNRIAGWATVMALHPDAAPVRISKLPVIPEIADGLTEEPTLSGEDAEVVLVDEIEEPKKKKRGK